MTSDLRAERTLARPAAVSGFGYWTGLEVRVEFRPAPPGHGISFVRRDILGTPRVVAHVTQRRDIPRRTCLKSPLAQVDMVEHVLAALRGLDIDNCEIWVDRAEMPGLDGSAKPYTDALLAAGTISQKSWRPQLVVRRRTRLGDNAAWIEAQPWTAGLRLTYHLDYPACPAIGRQAIDLVINPDTFTRQLAPARTFLLETEAQAMRAQGLAQHVSFEEVLVFGSDGPIQNAVRFPDECVRHKTLDVVGDLALVPFEIRAHITAFRSGHRLNAELCRRLLQEADIIAPHRRSA